MTTDTHAYELAECKTMLIAAGYDDAIIETTKHGFKITTNDGINDFVKIIPPEPDLNPVWVDMKGLLEEAPEPESFRQPGMAHPGNRYGNAPGQSQTSTARRRSQR